MKFEHREMILESTSTEDALWAVKYFGYLPCEFMAEVEAGQASPALARLYDWATNPDRVARIINLTEQPATWQQLSEDVVDLSEAERARVQKLVTFNHLPQENLLAARAADLAQIAVQAGATHALIAGAPYLMHHLVDALKAEGVQPLFAFPSGGFVPA